ncbi:hypothetical protein NA57DRAFT_55063 [Rhizodiscina lignyota]|uniref:Uncharacterized protein n=1 Tax=Rhizodiscina lignyota TaxID=1504668 RepID=A0A9P4IH88_9PEZI|nr:hypothetical protein NA57DRAFT_55063 [Rhizodiscina lignyota]
MSENDDSRWTGWQPLLVSLVICAVLILLVGLGVWWHRMHRSSLREIQDSRVPTPLRNRTPDALHDSAVELNRDSLAGSTLPVKRSWWRISEGPVKSDKVKHWAPGLKAIKDLLQPYLPCRKQTRPRAHAKEHLDMQR